ncbi:MAG: thiamine-phosphate kinase [Beijerinckiaceae bacterium]|nr:thiamine-phosphate kinase [Beijerinckiaceae bacterium]
MSSPLSEDELIATLFAPIAGPGALGLKDDVACFTPPAGCDLVVTADAIVAGVHFLPDDPPETIARKALRVNVSDLAAKGADPLGFVLTIAFPQDVQVDWIAAFALALGEDSRLWLCPLLGGDTVRTRGPLTISITALGAVPTGALVARTGARAGDLLYVSGFIGDAALGLHVRQGEKPWAARLVGASRDYLIERFMHPQPRLDLRHVVRDHASGAMDVSDGLVGDLSKMMRASRVSGKVELARVPLSDAVRAAMRLESALFETAVTGGDDYEILCSVPQSHAAAFEAGARAVGVPVARIGYVSDEDHPGAEFFDGNGHRKTFARGSYSHF